MIEPRIETISEKKLIGKRLTMSFVRYTIGELWQSFVPRRKEITNNLTNDLVSLVIYGPEHFIDFKPTNDFERWAAVEVEILKAYQQEWRPLFCRAAFTQCLTIKDRVQNILFFNIFLEPGCLLPTTF